MANRDEALKWDDESSRKCNEFLSYDEKTDQLHEC